MSVLVGGFRINMHSKHIEFNVHCMWNGSGKKSAWEENLYGMRYMLNFSMLYGMGSNLSMHMYLHLI